VLAPLWLLAAAPLWLLAPLWLPNFDMTSTTHKLQVNKHTTMKIEVIVSSHFPPFTPSLSFSPSQQELFLVSLLCGAN
jgi:hypothetical protein